MTYIIEYLVGNQYRTKTVKADNMTAAVKKARVKSVVSIDIKEYQQNDAYLLRDFWSPRAPVSIKACRGLLVTT